MVYLISLMLGIISPYTSLVAAHFKTVYHLSPSHHETLKTFLNGSPFSQIKQVSTWVLAKVVIDILVS